MTLTPQEIAEILEQLRDSQCEEFQLTLGDDTLSLRRNVAGCSGAAPFPLKEPGPRRAPAPAPKSPVAAEKEAVPPRRPLATGSAQNSLTAPMSGVFYRSPSPDEPPFVEEGVQVREGDPVCLIEVMKLFSTLYADLDGRVTGIHVDDGDSVEKGQPLLTIEPAQS